VSEPLLTFLDALLMAVSIRLKYSLDFYLILFLELPMTSSPCPCFVPLIQRHVRSCQCGEYSSAVGNRR